MNQRLQKAVADLIAHLVATRYAEIEQLTRGVGLNAEEIANAIKQYGRRLVPVPDDAFGLMEVVAMRDAAVPTWSVAMPLWTQEEGRSDLSIHVTILQIGERLAIELDDIRVP